ncbi:MAG: biotin--[acetyl-CoA-carboxylase] ligase [Planctomycetota bacterium]
MTDPTADEPLNESHADRVLEETFIEQAEFFAELPSTNDHALRLATDSVTRFPLLVVAEEQTSGRGRRANQWWSTKGALTFSVVLDTENAGLETKHWPQVALTTGLAVCEAIEPLLTGVPPKLKWPNDVYIGERKLCGVLVETPPGGQQRLVLGVGVNVNNSLASAPVDLRETATSLRDSLGRNVLRHNLLVDILQTLAQRLTWIGSRDDQLRQRWRARCHLTGRRVQVENEAGVVAGVCLGIDHDGALLIEDVHVQHRVLAGTVSILD